MDIESVENLQNWIQMEGKLDSPLLTVLNWVKELIRERDELKIEIQKRESGEI